MRSTILLGTMILTLVLTTPGGAAPDEEPVRRAAAEEDRLEEASEPGPAQGDARKRSTQPGQMPTLPPPRKETKKRRRPPASLEITEEIETATAEGFSLDYALRRLLAANRDLAVKYQDIPKARADILSAGLIENPALFLDNEGIPYGNYSPQRPGATSYGATVILPPLDVSGKRGKRLAVARHAEKVLEALYQDAVRQEIDKLYSAYVDVLETSVRRNALRRAVTRMKAMVESVRALADRGVLPPTDVTEAAVRRGNTAIALREAEANLLEARRELALLLAVPAEQADAVRIRGSLRDPAAPPPKTDELIQAALRTRPDLAAFQLSVERAQANVQLSRAERWDNLLLFYTPYEGITFPSQGKRTATAWEVGGLGILPVLERNRGDITRGQANVAQLQIQLRGLRDRVIYEVQRAASDYAISRQLLQKYESTILPRARRLRDDKQRRFTQGQESFDAFLTADQNYDEVVQRYLETLVNHRRGMLRLNTVVGQRILP